MRRQDGTRRDSLYYSLLADEWPTVRDTLRARITPRQPLIQGAEFLWAAGLVVAPTPIPGGEHRGMAVSAPETRRSPSRKVSSNPRTRSSKLGT
jgi:hypothetical protein